MPDLHGWITQQIDRVEQTARAVEDRSAPWDGQWVADGPDALRTYNGHVLFYGHNWPLKPGLVEHVALHDPATVLRRCAADRKILARHRLNPDAYWCDAAMCDGCGTEGEMGYAVTENLNDCPELLDIAEAHGLTPEILATLDRPQDGERPEPTGPSLLPDGLAEAMYGNLLRTVMTTDMRTVEPRLHVKVIGPGPLSPVPQWFTSPGERAFAVVEPHLSALALYKPDTNPEA